MSEKIRVLLSEEEVDARIQEVADMINKDYDCLLYTSRCV